MIEFRNIPVDLTYFDLVPMREWFMRNPAPLIIVGAIPRDVCAQVIELNSARALEPSVHPVIGKGRQVLDTEYRNTSFLRDPALAEAQRLFDPQLYAQQINEHWDVSFSYKLLNGAPPVYTVFKTGEYCNTHVDSVIIDGKLGYASKEGRRLSMLAYLNDWAPAGKGTFSGGELIFSSLVDAYGNLYTYRPKAGDVVIFPSTPLYPHNVPRVTRGSRHTLLQWVQLS